MTVTGATGLVGRALVPALQERGIEVTVLTRDPDRARATFGAGTSQLPEAVRWDLLSEPAPAAALSGREAVLHLAGEPVAQRWSVRAKRAILESRVSGTRNLIAGLRASGGPETGRPPATLVSSSAVGYYGAHAEEPLDEESPPGKDFLARVCVAWEREARRASELGLRVVCVRTGVVLDPGGGALAKMLPPFRLGLGGPVAGGRQYMSWIHTDDLIGMMLAALDDQEWRGPVNATAPEPVSNGEFSRVLGRVMRRPAVTPVPAVALRLLYGEMAEIVTTGARVVPAKPLMLGYQFHQPALEPALRSAVAGA